MNEQSKRRLSRRQTVEQERATYALGCIRRAQAGPDGQDGAYRRDAGGLPVMLLVNGLGQTLAFLKAKKKGALYHDLSDGVGARLRLEGDLLEAVTAMDVARYRLAQTEALALAGWLKRLAEAELPEPEARR